MNLTNEEIKALIRKSQGWTELKEGPRQYGWKHGNKWHYLHDVPNYPADLNATHEMEATLEWEQFADYQTKLEKVVQSEWTERSRFPCHREFATARHRCIAYLKTKGLIP